MMLLDHIASSIILSNSVSTIRKKRALWIVCIITSIIPDILAFYYHPGSIEYLFHRRYTNSIILTPFYVLLIAAVYKLIFIKTPLPYYQYYLVTLSSYFLHIGLDLITPFGSPLFFPLSDRLYSFDIIHSFDPISLTISSIVIVSSLFFIFKKWKSYNKILRFSLYNYIVYFSFMILFKMVISQEYNKQITLNYTDVIYEATIPRTFWRWKGIGEDKANKYVIYSENDSVIVRTFEKNIQIPSVIIKNHDYNKFIDYARYPATLVNKHNYSFINLIYSSNSYRLTFELDSNDSIITTHITGFDIFDKQ